MSKPLLRRALIILFLLPAMLGSTWAQQAELTDFLRKFQEYQEANPAEKIFLHLDKTEYAQAETIWLKSYLVAGPGHIPSPLSQNVYVELVSDNGLIVDRHTLKSEEGLSKASIIIPKDLSQGQYYLRAYTNWMKNAGQDYFFSKKINIQSLDPEEQITPLKLEVRPQLKFYPEGGQMVQDVNARLAFELTGVDTEDKQYSGDIFNSKDEKVASFNTSHEGRGLMTFLPEKSGYYARIAGVIGRFDLPEVQGTGVVMSVNNKRADFLTVSIKSNEVGCEPYYLVAHTRGYVTYASQVTMTGTRGFSKISKESLSEGITHVTLLNKSLQPVAERLAFINTGKGLNLSITPNKANLGPRELVTVGIKVTDKNGKPVKGSFSLSAFDPGLVQNDQLDYNIRTHLLLNSDLKGQIKDPSQYLGEDEEARNNLDLLMMVNGWRRFDWSDIGQTKENLYAVETGLSIEGRLLKNGGNPAKMGKVLLINSRNPEDDSRFVMTTEEGNFRFEDLEFYDTTTLTLQGFQRAAMKNVQFEINNTYERFPLSNRYQTSSVFDNPLRVSAFKKYAQTAIYIDSTYRRVNGITYLDDVTVVADKRREKYRVLQSRYGLGESFVNFDEIPYEQKSGRDPFRLMLGRVAGFTLLRPSSTDRGVSFNGSADTLNAFLTDPMMRIPRLRQGPFIGAPLIFLNNVEVSFDQIYDLRATDIDYVEVYKSSSAGAFGSRGLSGAIAFYTLKGKKYFDQLPKKGMLLTQLDGYHTAREFYSPSYAEKSPQYIPDQRATVFWAPMVSTNENGEATVQFYTPDQSAYIYIDVQGLSVNGLAGFGNSGFSIRSNF